MFRLRASPETPMVCRLHDRLRRALSVCAVAATGVLAGCTDDAAELFNCYLAADVPPIVIRESSATDASKKCEEEQGQACTCSAVSYRGIVSPN
jgi:hypothetical protein